MIYRKATLDDYLQIVQMKNNVKQRIINQELPIWLNGYPLDELIKEDINEEEGRVIEVDNEVVAYAVFYHCSKEYDHAFKKNNLQSFGRLMVKDGYVGKHIGDFLVKSMIQEAKSLNVEGLGISVDSVNIRAVNLYKKHGFVKEGEQQFPWAYLDKYVLYFKEDNMNKLEQLCEDIKLQESIKERVLSFSKEFDFSLIRELMDKLMIIDSGFEAYEKLTEYFKDDEDCIKILSSYLMCALEVREKYVQKGIDDKVFVDTMGCFVRFINECKVKTGREGFDRAYWTYRQLSMVVFRLHELEFELKELENEKIIKIHIPSDSKFTSENVDISLNLLKDFVSKYYPEFENVKLVCDSWLLSLKLRELLDENSNIRSFQDRFEIISQNYEAKDFIVWLFMTHINCDINQLREDTSLQRRVKKLLLDGGNIGSGYGILKGTSNGN